MSKARWEFYSNFIDEDSGDQRKLFRARQRFFNHTVDDGLPSHLDNATQFSNDLAKYFVHKIEAIRRQLDTDQTDSNQGDDTPSAVLVESMPLLPAFKMLSASDVKQIFQKSPPSTIH